jgi:anti-sigma factor RsiW
MVDERTELLINRKLDGELRDGELLELNRLLIRSPEARRMLEDYERNDRMAAAALQTALAECPAVRPPRGAAATAQRAAGMARRRRRAIRLGRLAPIVGLAAAVALVFMTAPETPRSATIRQAEVRQATLGSFVDPAPVNVVPVAAAMPAVSELMDGPRRERQRLLRDLVGVVDPETRSIYFLQVDSTHTTVEPDVLEY